MLRAPLTTTPLSGDCSLPHFSPRLTPHGNPSPLILLRHFRLILFLDSFLNLGWFAISHVSHWQSFPLSPWGFYLGFYPSVHTPFPFPYSLPSSFAPRSTLLTPSLLLCSSPVSWAHPHYLGYGKVTPFQHGRSLFHLACILVLFVTSAPGGMNFHLRISTVFINNIIIYPLVYYR